MPGRATTVVPSACKACARASFGGEIMQIAASMPVLSTAFVNAALPVRWPSSGAGVFGIFARKIIGAQEEPRFSI
jgi:hypothetical protein